MPHSIVKCRICGNHNLVDIFNVGEQAITSRFPAPDEPDPPIIPMVLTQCRASKECHDACCLVQMRHTVPPGEMYLQTYGYRSGVNKTMITHLKGIHDEMVAKHIELSIGDVVLDIGSNDGTLLSFYSNKLQRLGIDPTGSQFEQYYEPGVALVPDYFSKDTFVQAVGSDTKAQCVTTISMFYDLPDPLGFMRDVADILDASKGIWIMEQSYLPSMLEENSFDTICHEHLEYYALHQIQWMVDKAGLRIFDVSKNDCNGGSFRIYICHNTASYETNLMNINEMMRFEINLAINTSEPFVAFQKRCEDQKRRLQLFMKCAKQQGRDVYLYGASTKGNTLLQYYGLDATMIVGAAERNPVKFGRRTPGTNIPIFSEDEVRRKNPPYMLVLPWHFREEFLARESYYLDNGGQFIFPLPVASIVSNKKRALITGASGQIGHYLIDELVKQGYHVYGTSRRVGVKDSRVFYFPTPDHHDVVGWEDLIEFIRPDEVFHIAAQTSSIRSIEKPIESLDVNGTLTGILLDVIHRKLPQARFIHANSTELFKGCSNGVTVNEETPFHPRTPYAIGKVASYWLVRYYRDVHGLACCSGILTNTESPLRSDEYVTQKVCKYLKHVQNGGNRGLKLGNIEVHRDWMHAADATTALIQMINQDSGCMQDCIIATGETHTVREWVEHAVDLAGFKSLCDAGIEEDCTKNRVYEPIARLTYDNSRLKSLGWQKNYSFKNIIAHMMD